MHYLRKHHFSHSLKGSLPILCLLIPFALSLLLSSCARQSSPQLQSKLLTQARVLEQEKSQLKSELKARKKEAANLELELLKKSAEIQRLKAIEKDLMQEVLRGKSKLLSTKTKAEAVVQLAETESEIGTLKSLDRTGLPNQSLLISNQLLQESRTALDHGNYNKACALATQALEQIRSKQFNTVSGAEPVKGSANTFVFPLYMRVTKTSNIRQHPGMTSRVVRIVDKGTKVTATGYKGHWIKVTVDDQPTGWIYYSLLTLLKS